MKTSVRILFVILIGLAGLARWARPSSAQENGSAADYQIFLPLAIQAVDTSSAGIIVDHRHSDINLIPTQWIAAAKSFSIHYAHTSHGSQVLTGLKWLESRSSDYNVNIELSGEVVHPQAAEALNIYDGNNYPGDTYILPGMYWESAEGLVHTRSVVDTRWFDVSLWTWCGQMSTYNEAQVEEYLSKIAVLQSEYPNVRFILFTGHTDGSAPGSRLWRNNERVRQYVRQQGGVLFDFADIESYDPNGNFYPSGSDACEWCEDWCAVNPDHFACQSLPSGCAHTDGLQCTLKGQAFWYLLARLAGWNGQSSH